jgi:transposase
MSRGRPRVASSRRLFRTTLRQGCGGIAGLVHQGLSYVTRQGKSARRAAFLLLKPPEQLDHDEIGTVARLEQSSPQVATASRLVHEFAQMVRGRQRDHLDEWLQAAYASGIRELRYFARGLQRDYEAVAAGLSLPWSSGPTEEHINRLKTLKRQMYGKAGFKLLRQRVLNRV